MGYQLAIPEYLNRYGVQVETLPGWQTRGSSAFFPKATTCHWTAGPRGTLGRPSLNVVTYGRPGIPGPLANVYLARTGVAVVVAAGRANHAGTGGFRGLTGNSSVFGIEAESAGNDDWTPEQRAAYPRVVAALQALAGRDASWAHGHNEWAPSRKIDIRDWDMNRMRAEVAAVLAGAGFTPGGATGNVVIPAVPAPGPVYTKEYIKRIQTLLNQAGYNLEVDGVRGALTIAAVKDYQGKNNLAVDGYPGAKTLASLNARVVNTPVPAPARPVFHGTPGVHTGNLTRDGNLELVLDGKPGSGTYARLQQVMGTPIDGMISTPSTVWEAVQRYLNVIAAGHIKNLTGQATLKPDGFKGPKTVKVLQFVLFNHHSQAVLGRPINLAKDCDGIDGVQTWKLFQYALNRATAGSGRF